MKAKVIGKVSPEAMSCIVAETVRRIKRTYGKKVQKRPGFHMPFAGLGTMIYGGNCGKDKCRA